MNGSQLSRLAVLVTLGGLTISCTAQSHCAFDNASQSGALTRIEELAKAEILFRAGNGQYGDLDELVHAGLTSDPSKAHVGKVYLFDVRRTADRFEIRAVPLRYSRATRLSFYMDDAEIVRVADRNGQPPTPQDRPINEPG